MIPVTTVSNDFVQRLGGHRYQPLDRFDLREVSGRRVMFMLRVMTYVVSYKLFWN